MLQCLIRLPLASGGAASPWNNTCPAQYFHSKNKPGTHLVASSLLSIFCFLFPQPPYPVFFSRTQISLTFRLLASFNKHLPVTFLFSVTCLLLDMPVTYNHVKSLRYSRFFTGSWVKHPPHSRPFLLSSIYAPIMVFPTTCHRHPSHTSLSHSLQ